MAINHSIQQADITIISIYAPNNRPPKYIAQKMTELKGEINSSTMILGDFNTLLAIMDRPTIQDIKK